MGGVCGGVCGGGLGGHKQKGWSCVCASGVRAFPSEILIFICSPTIDVEQLVCSSQRDAWRPGAGGGVWCRVKEACSWERVVMAAMERVLWVWTVGRRSGMWGSRGRGGELYDYGASPGACNGYTRCAERSAPACFVMCLE